MFLILFISSLGFADDSIVNPEDVVSSVVEQTMPLQVQPSPYLSCGIRKEVAGQAHVKSLQAQIPKYDAAKIKTLDFFKELVKRIEDASVENLLFTESISRCMAQTVRKDAECEEIRDWALQPVSPNEHLNDESTTLWHQLKLARAHLAIASHSPTSQNFLEPNSNLDLFGGYKSVPWIPLSSSEKQIASNNLSKYKKQFIEKYHMNIGELVENKKEVHRSVMRKQMYRYVRKMREKHLQEYRAIMSRFPILTYISGSKANLTEVYVAAQRMKPSAKKELDHIQKIKKQLELTQNDEVPPDALQLLDYGGLVEGLLSDQPKFCGVASSSVTVRGTRELRSTLIVAGPVLLACFLAPPMRAVVVGGVASSVTITQSYFYYKDQEAAYLSRPKDDGAGRASLESVEDSHSAFVQELTMLPIDMLLGGGASKGVLFPRKIKSNSTIKPK